MSFDTNLDSIAKLDECWDGYRSPSGDVFARAITTARQIIAVPGGDGSIQIELHAGGSDVEILIDREGKVRAVSVERREDV